MNAVEIEEAISELASQPFDRAEFAFQFLAGFGNKATTIKRLRAAGGSNASDVAHGILQRNNIHLATCEVGEVDATLQALRDSPKTATAKAKFILATDGETLAAEDVTSDDPPIACEFTDFPNHFGFFLPLAGITTVKQIRESSFDIRATGRLNKLYVELLNDNPDWAEPARRPDMNHFMARLIFCFFAEDTDIFNGEGLFTRTVEQMSARDSRDTHEIIGNIFRAMDTRPAERAGANIPPHANGFPYVNGSLFSGSTDAPVFSRIARSFLINIGTLDWKKINPDIFGSMIQAVADDEERGALGMHYTSVPNILKVLNPLFLDDLRAQLEAAGDNARKLLNLRSRMAKIRVFDPACGSGNFLVIAYKQMRAIEAVINAKRGEAERRSDIPLTNYRGIELRHFPAEIARLALIIAEYQCDVTYRGQKEALAEFLPLDSENWITCDNALRIDWLSVCPPTGTAVKLRGDDLYSTPLDQSEIDFENEGGETYICGNPPYIGSSVQTLEQKSDLEWLFAKSLKSWKNLDYISGWFFKAANFCNMSPSDLAFVSTNSICQGQQVPLIWPKLLELGIRIHFAHSSFKWSNLAAHNAGVTVVIVGCSISQGTATLYSIDSSGESVKREVPAINPYLVSGATMVVQAKSKPPNGLGLMYKGNMPSDGGFLILESAEAAELIETAPKAAEFIYQYSGSRDFIQGHLRYCLWIDDKDANRAAEIAAIKLRLDGVRHFRSTAKAVTTRPYAEYPHKFRQIQDVARNNSIIIPRHTSERREFLPFGLLPADAIISDSALAIYDAPYWNMAIIGSRLHLVWVATVCGKIKTDFRYSNTFGWNAFPLPQLTEQNKADLTKCAEDILLAREAHYPATIADLYDPEAMDEKYPDLRRAHDANDETLERIYIGRRFKNDTERLEKLFELYTRMTTGKAVA